MIEEVKVYEITKLLFSCVQEKALSSIETGRITELVIFFSFFIFWKFHCTFENTFLIKDERVRDLSSCCWMNHSPDLTCTMNLISVIFVIISRKCDSARYWWLSREIYLKCQYRSSTSSSDLNVCPLIVLQCFKKNPSCSKKSRTYQRTCLASFLISFRVDLRLCLRNHVLSKCVHQSILLMS